MKPLFKGRSVATKITNSLLILFLVIMATIALIIIVPREDARNLLGLNQTVEPTTDSTVEPTADPTMPPPPMTGVGEEPTAEPTADPTADPTEEPTAEPTEEPTEEPKQTAAPNPYGFVDDHGDVPVVVKILAMDDNPWRSRTVIVSERDGNKFLQTWKAGKLSMEVQVPSELGQGGKLSIFSIGERIEIDEHISDENSVYFYQDNGSKFHIRYFSSEMPEDGILLFGTTDGRAVVFDQKTKKTGEIQLEKAPVEVRGEFFVQGECSKNYKEVMNG